MSWNSFQLNIFREPNMAGGTYNTLQENMFVKFVFSKKATKFDKIFTVDLTLCKGQLNSEWIYEVIVYPKMPTKIFPDFCPERVGQKSGKILVGILGETMTS